MNKRHEFVYKYSIKHQIDDNTVVDVDTTKWTDCTPQGLSGFIKVTLPDWKRLMIVKTVIIIDPQKKDGGNIVGKKESHLRLSRFNSSEVKYIKVNADLTAKDGVIPAHIYDFFGNKNVR